MSLDLAEQCEVGQRLLIETQYLDAADVLEGATQAALRAGNWDLLARACLPLQEARRQIRQRCGEGAVHLHLLAEGPDRQPSAEELVGRYPQGQLLVAGWGGCEPAEEIRRLARERKLYLEAFLASVYPTDRGLAVAIFPSRPDVVPAPGGHAFVDLRRELPQGTLVLHESELPAGPVPGSYRTYAITMELWERLAAPFLGAADAISDPRQRIDGYLRTIEVDSACELAYQKLAIASRTLLLEQRQAHLSTDPA